MTGVRARLIQGLTGLHQPDRAKAAKMLRRGLEACDPSAVSAVEGARWRDFCPT